MPACDLPPSSGAASNAATVSLIAGCKVNLGLRITGIRADGYHELDSVFVPLAAPADRLDITIRPDAAPDIRVTCDAAILDPADNTLTKAYAAFCRRAVTAPPALDVRLHKHIPAGAGLGGGSSDAAALLRWLNSIAPSPLSADELAAAALSAGADVPFFLLNRPCRVRGIGDMLEPVELDLPETCLLLVCPGETVSTPWAYRAYDAMAAEKKREGTQGGLTSTAIQANGTALSTMPDFSAAATACFRRRDALSMCNDLEDVVTRAYPVIRAARQALTRYGAWAVVMSGSGSAVVGLVAAERAQEAHAALTGDGWRTYVQTL